MKQYSKAIVKIVITLTLFYKNVYGKDVIITKSKVNSYHISVRKIITSQLHGYKHTGHTISTISKHEKLKMTKHTVINDLILNYNEYHFYLLGCQRLTSLVTPILPSVCCIVIPNITVAYLLVNIRYQEIGS